MSSLKHVRCCNQFVVHVREGLPGTDELTIPGGFSGTDEHFGTPSGYEIGDRVMVSGCGSICIPINVSSSTNLEIHR